MLKENPKLRNLWRGAKKTKDKYGTVGLDMRHKSSKEFLKGFSEHIAETTTEKDLEILKMI